MTAELSVADFNMTAFANIAVLGAGAMGSRMAANLLKAGFSVTIWNRTYDAASALVARGAKQASTPRGAAERADLVIAMVRDDDASREVWLAPHTGAMAGLGSKAIAIESSTLTPGWIRKFGAEFEANNLVFLEAPVVGSRPQAEAAQLTYLAGGEETVLRQAEPVLRVTGSSIHHVGPLGSGALVKLATNALLGVQVTALAELIGLLKRSGTDVSSAMKAIATTAAWSPAAANLSASMMTGNFAPQFPVELIEKDFGYVVALAGSPPSPTLNAAHSVFQRGLAADLGQENMTSVVKLFEESHSASRSAADH